MTVRTARAEKGTSTAEYAVGTLGACTVALVLHAVASDSGWVYDIIREALAWRDFLDGFPVPNLRVL
jgi:hypothetical protein